MSITKGLNNKPLRKTLQNKLYLSNILRINNK